MMVNLCACMGVVSIWQGTLAVVEEIPELLKAAFIKRSWYEVKDEASDIMFGVGRFAGAIRGVPYVPMPGTKMHMKKAHARMASYGCVRSMRNVKEGNSCVS